jgi:DHA1 family bicyclomycin/chloramphenicol resistance-like MFS transporter
MTSPATIRPVMGRRKLAAIGALLIALGPISMALYTPAMPRLVEVFGTDIATIKLTLTAYFAGFAVMQLVCGPLSDQFGRRPVVIGFTGLYLAASLVAAFAPTVDWLLGARLVQGMGAAAGVSIARAMVRDLYTGQESSRVMSVIGLMLGVGPALAPTIGGIMLDLVNWQAIFVAMVAYGLVILAVFLTVVPETLPVERRASARPRVLLSRYRVLATDVRFLSPALVLGAALGAIYAMATMLPFVLIDRVGLTPSAFGIGMVAQSGTFMAGSTLTHRLLGRYEADALVAPGLAAVGLGGALLAVLMRVAEPSFLTVMGPVGLIAFGNAMLIPAMTTAVLHPFPHMAGAAAALSGFMQMASGFLGSALAALMADAVTALGTIAPCMAAVAIGAYWAGRRTGALAGRSAQQVAPGAPAE